MSEKIIGYLFLIVGLLIAGYSCFSMYQVFTKRTEPVQLFTFAGISLDPAKFTAGSLPAGIPSQITQQLQVGMKAMEIIPANVLNDTSNIFAHMLLMGFVASIGFRLATLGATLVRPIVVHLRPKSELVDSVR
jgi:hypothetical protein